MNSNSDFKIKLVLLIQRQERKGEGEFGTTSSKISLVIITTHYLTINLVFKFAMQDDSFERRGPEDDNCNPECDADHEW